MYNPFFKATFYQTRTIAQNIKDEPKYRLEINKCIERFIAKDWGDLTHDDIKSNNEAITYSDRILASYKTSKGKIYIIADATDKNYYETVTVLFASEY